MVRIAPVKLRYNSRALWFDARDLEIREGDPVIVLTARGLEFGRVAAAVFEASDDEVKSLKSPLKPVKRIATDEDAAHMEELDRKSAEALPVFRELAAQVNEEMHPVAVEYLFGGDKAVFYFEAENRIDFRELVHKLAAEFHVRVDMRQVGVRDEARMIGGLGHCGQELCCKRFGGDFNPVSIRMAKEQDLSLNPQKISGLCGRLMCCLRYEYEAYKDFKSRAPKINSTVKTPEGPAKVTGLDVPREIITVRVEGGKDVKIPFDEMEPPEGDATRRTAVGAEAWERAVEGENATHLIDVRFSAPQFTRSDKLGEAKAVRRSGSSAEKKNGGQADERVKSTDEAAQGRRRKRRRSTKVESESRSEAAARAGSSEKAVDASGEKEAPESSRKRKGMQPRRRGRSAKIGVSQQTASEEESQRRSARDGSEGPSRKRSSRGAKAKPKATTDAQGGRSDEGRQRAGQQDSPRPGQKSSGLRQGASRAGRSGGSGDEPSQQTHRTARRRSHKAGGSASGASKGGPSRRERGRGHDGNGSGKGEDAKGGAGA